MTQALNFTFVELSKFNKNESELANLEDGLYFCLKHMGKLSKRPDNLDAAVYRKLFEVAEFVKMPVDQRKTYIAKMNTERDIINQLAYAKRIAMEEGRAEGKAEGLEEARLEIAKAMRDKGVSTDIIVECSGLTLETIKAL